MSRAQEMASLLSELKRRQNELSDEIRQNQQRIRDLQIELTNVERDEANQKRIREQEAEEQRKLAELQNSLAKTARTIEALQPHAWQSAHDFQKEDIVTIVNAYSRNMGGFVNANDMGLGKTLEAIVTLETLFKIKPGAKALWLTKTSILETGGTHREIQRWSDGLLKTAVMKGSAPKQHREFTVELFKENMSGTVLLTNYEAVRSTDAFKELTFDFVVMDEVHKLKGGANQSGPTEVWKSVKEVAHRASFILMLTGTPMVNRVAELWAYLHIFDPERFDNLRKFERAYNLYQGRCRRCRCRENS
jgi:SNF2 family DNA or RNA helicase